MMAASCSLGGALNIKVLNFYSGINKTRCAGLETRNETIFGRLETSRGIRAIQIKQEPVHFFSSSRKPWRSANPLIVACVASSQTENQSRDCSEEKKNVRMTRQFMPNSSEVQSLLTSVCDTTSIAEFKLDFGGFRLYLKRDLQEKIVPPPIPPSPPPMHTDTSNQTPALNGSAATTSLAISKPKPSSGGIQRFLDAASDEGLVVLQSPKVGFFRRSRTIKGKRAPPSCKEKQDVKEGQVLCYIEQLGGEIPIESDVSGEVIKILRDDGEPVGYGDALIAVLPSFPGIKKLQQ